MFIVLSYYFYRTFATLFISVLTDGAAEDAALAERERRGGWVADGGYVALAARAAGIYAIIHLAFPVNRRAERADKERAAEQRRNRPRAR